MLSYQFILASIFFARLLGYLMISACTNFGAFMAILNYLGKKGLV